MPSSVPQTTIGLILFPDATQLDLTAPYEVFARIPGAKTHVIGAELAPVRTDRGLLIVPDTTYDACPPLDVLFVPGGPGQIDAEADEKLTGFIARHAAREDAIVSSVCTGALLLGALGLLRGKKATTHWACMDILPFYGAVPVDAPVVDEGRIVTGAGVSNGIDLALCVAEKLRGGKTARRIGRQIEYPHASAVAERDALDLLSAELLAENPFRAARIEAAKRAAQRLKIAYASDIKYAS